MISPLLQAKLLGCFQEKEVERLELCLGSAMCVFISLQTKDLEEEVKREISGRTSIITKVVAINIPPLRERKRTYLYFGLLIKRLKIH